MADFISGGIGTRIGRPALSRRGERKNVSSDVRDHLPTRAELNYIPSPDILDDLITRARMALSKGFYWDRGSILNIVL